MMSLYDIFQILEKREIQILENIKKREQHKINNGLRQQTDQQEIPLFKSGI